MQRFAFAARSSCLKIFNAKFALALGGTQDWKNLSIVLNKHENSPAHLESFQKWKELETRLNTNTTIDDKNQRIIKAETQHWQNVLERLIALIRVLGTQNIALRGTSDKLFEPNNGNFLKFVELMGMFDSVIKEHIRRITSHEIHNHYLGKNIQNEIIQLLATHIKETVLSALKKAKYYSVSLDCTPDISNIEQMTLIVRFVSVTGPFGNAAGSVNIREHFLEFLELKNSSGAGMTELLLQKLGELGLDVADLRGQGYDNGANMKGKHSGVQKRIRDLNPRAFFLPCSSHSLNLVVNDAANCCTDAIEFFNIVQTIYAFFSASTYRWDVLKEHTKSLSLTVKPLSNTRWESRVEAAYNGAQQSSALNFCSLSVSESFCTASVVNHFEFQVFLDGS
nr:PREDICTED: zinc finger MYM-type protein 1-like [Latimeria chalumnae]|eukprot:XP_006011780.1 PREDICTED: zinc finger MYM-type protein 1-like [Latimeria chalumnae]